MKKIVLAMTIALCCAALVQAGTNGYAYFKNYAPLDPTPSSEFGGQYYSCYVITSATVTTSADLETWLKENGGITRENIAMKGTDVGCSGCSWNGQDQEYAFKMNNTNPLIFGEAGENKYAVILATNKTSGIPDFAYEILKGEETIFGTQSDWSFSDSTEGSVCWTPAPVVTVTVPEVAGATAELFAFYANCGWMTAVPDKVPSNATVRVVWTADAGKGLTADKAKGAYQWQAELVADKAVQTAPAPTVGEADSSEVSLDIDTRAKKSYFDAKDILPVWYAQGNEVKVQGQGQQSWETLVRCPATNDTVLWTPAEPDAYTLSQTAFENATIFYTLPVEVTTNDLEVAGTTVAVTADGAAVEPQTEGEFAGKLIVPSNSVITVTWTATEKGTYFADGSTTYSQMFKADKSVNPASESVEAPKAPAAPSVMLGVVAQRYPWKGMLDVNYLAKNTPNGYQIKVTVTLPDGTSASQESDAKNGKNTTTFDAKKAFGEVKFATGVTVTAELVEAAPPM